MKNDNKSFIILLGIAAVMTMGVIAENAFLVLNPKRAGVKIDVEKVKKGINEAGLTPREAVHWDELK